MDTVMMIVATEAQHAIEKVEGDLTAKLKAAMKCAHNHWMCTDKDAQFRGAIAGVMTHYGTDSEEFKQLEWEMRQLRQLSAMINAAQAGLNVSLPDMDDERKPIGIMKLWHEVATVD